MKTKERAVYIPFTAIILVVFILLLGIAVDVGQLYRTKLRIQRATDAAVFTSSRMIGTHKESDVENVAEEMARDNVHFMDRRLTDFTPVAQKVGNVLSMDGRTSQPTLLMNIMPGIAPRNNVSARSKAANQRAVIVFVLDLSGSMLLDAGNPIDKIGILRDALKSFIDDSKFKDGWDYIGVVGFHRMALEFENLNSPLDKKALKGKISLLGKGADGVTDERFPNGDFTTDLLPKKNSLRSGTNPDFGLRKAKEMLLAFRSNPSTASLYDDSNKMIVLVTDGSPTASCADDPSSTDCISILPIWPSGARPFCTHQLHLERAILQADDIRSDSRLRIPIHTVGLGKSQGTPIPDGPFAGYFTSELMTAYQGFNTNLIDDNDSLRGNFLRRIALINDAPGLAIDTNLGTSNVFPPSGTPNFNFGSPLTSYFRQFPSNTTSDPIPDKECDTNNDSALLIRRSVSRISEYVTAYGTPNGDGPPRGFYRFTDNPALDLKAILDSIAASVKSRLVG